MYVLEKAQRQTITAIVTRFCEFAQLQVRTPQKPNPQSQLLGAIDNGSIFVAISPPTPIALLAAVVLRSLQSTVAKLF